MRHFGKTSEIAKKKETVDRRVYKLKQLLIIFSCVALVQLAMRNRPGKMAQYAEPY